MTRASSNTHSHLGVYASPGVWAHADGNEMTSPITAGVRAEEGFWPQDPGLERAVAGGVTTLHILPGSGNLMGGRGVTLKLHPALETAAMRFPGAKDSLKMACGENPKRVYGRDKGAMPMSRMGSLYMMRSKWLEARRYRLKWDSGARSPTRRRTVAVSPPTRPSAIWCLRPWLKSSPRGAAQIHCYPRR